MTRSYPHIPLILLKTRSQPTDNYATFFQSQLLPSASASGPASYTPIFIPVLTHRFALEPLLSSLSPSGTFPSHHHGLIFTSQRAVEALDSALHQLSTGTPTKPSAGRMLPAPPSASTDTSDNPDAPQHAGHILDSYHAAHGVLPPLYTVGPATSAALQRVANKYFAVRTRAGADYPVLGKDTGNGEKLAGFILENYDPPRLRGQSKDAAPRAPLLFFVGEQRRDIIPKTLMSEDLPLEKRIRVDEEVVYETAVEEGFEAEFQKVLAEKGPGASGRVWIVVFSPTGCEAMLRVLGWTRSSGWPDGMAGEGGRRKHYVATIGPTTRDYLKDEFGFEADVCAPKPSPEGIAEGIDDFERRLAV